MNDPKQSPDPVNIPPFVGRSPLEEKQDKEQGIKGTFIIDGVRIKVRVDEDIEQVFKREKGKNGKL